MGEVATSRKNKIELNEYDYLNDVQNRSLMAEFSPLDVRVLEEILYSSIKVSCASLAKNLKLPVEELRQALKKLTKTKLFTVSEDHVLVDKEMRKYYELQILKFEEDFKPGMEYLQGLLRKIPIHVLPNWYSIPRSSNNIFDSIIEKYLLTPQIFQRYLMELSLTDPAQKGIMNAVYHSPNYEVSAADLMTKFQLTQEQFEQHMLNLEFSFVCFVKFKREKDRFIEVVTPFYEWARYLNHVHETEPVSIIDDEHIIRKKQNDFAFITEMTTILKAAQKNPLPIENSREGLFSLEEKTFDALKKKGGEELSKADLHHLITKMCRLELSSIKENKLYALEEAEEWLSLNVREQALCIFRHPLNYLAREDLPEKLCSEKMIREAEKCITRALVANWVFLEDFLKGIFIPLSEAQVITLKRAKKGWEYQLPEYSDEELDFFRAVIKEWLFEVGIIALGLKEGRECFCVTAFGKDLFGCE